MGQSLPTSHEGPRQANLPGMPVYQPVRRHTVRGGNCFRRAWRNYQSRDAPSGEESRAAQCRRAGQFLSGERVRAPATAAEGFKGRLGNIDLSGQAVGGLQQAESQMLEHVAQLTHRHIQTEEIRRKSGPRG